MKLFIRMASMLLAILPTLTFAQGDSKCVTDKLQAVKGEQWFVSQEYGLMCHPGHIDGFRGCVDREVKTQSFPYEAPEGWAFDPDTASFVETSRNEHSRNSHRFTESTNKKITAEVHCNGHGCGGEGRVWIFGKTRVKGTRKPSSQEVGEIMRACGFP
jgi:hypothetical protein